MADSCEASIRSKASRRMEPLCCSITGAVCEPMKMLFHKALAFIKRDFSIESGYQAAFVMGLLEAIMLLVVFHFIGQLISPRASTSLGKYGTQYFPFVLAGVAFARY